MEKIEKIEKNQDYRPIMVLGLSSDATQADMERWLMWCVGRGYGGFAIVGSRGKKKLMGPGDIPGWLEGHLACSRYMCRRARELGLMVYIFDEWGFPSGTAAGLTIAKNHDHRAKVFHKYHDAILEAGESVALPVPPRFVSAAVLPVGRHATYSFHMPSTRVAPENGMLNFTAVRKSRFVAVTWEYTSFVTHVMTEDTPDNIITGTVDLLSAEATRDYLSVMHEGYERGLGEYFGDSVKGFFYDEPEIHFNYPYTHDLAEVFAKTHGYDLYDAMPALLAYVPGAYFTSGEAAGYVYKSFVDYRHVWNRMMAENFMGVMQKWCSERGLALVGHQDLDHRTHSLNSVSGDFFSNNIYNDHPGIDVIWEQIEPDRLDDFPRYAGSFKRFYNKKRAMSETFAEMGPAMFPDMVRFVTEQQIIRGIDEFFLMASGIPEGINDSEINSTPTNNPFRYKNLLHEKFGDLNSQRLAKLSELANAGRPMAEVAVYLPLDAMAYTQAQIYNPHTLNGKIPWEQVDKAAESLVYAPIDFEYVWDGALSMFSGAEGGLASHEGRVIGHIVLPEGFSYGADTYRELKRFTDCGGKLYTVAWVLRGNLPSVSLPDWRALVDILPKALYTDAQNIAICTREADGGKIVIAVNESSYYQIGSATFACGGEDDLVIEECTDGRMVLLSEDLSVNLCFAPRETKIFHIVDKAKKPECAEPECRDSRVVLDGFTLRLPDGREMDFDVPDFPDWADLGYGGYIGGMSYTNSFDWHGGDAVISLGDVKYAATVAIDGEEVLRLPFSPYEGRCHISKGSHTIEITVYNSGANDSMGTKELLEKYYPHGSWHNTRYMSSGLTDYVMIYELESRVGYL